MANTDLNEWRLLGTSLIAASTDYILPTGSSHLYQALNEPGSGELKIPLDSSSADAVSSGKFALASYRGGVRGGMFVENIGTFDADASEGGGRWMSVSGRGAMAMLDKVLIAGDGTTASTREFAAVTKGSILKTLIDEAVARGALSAFAYTFTATVDSSSVAWTDSETYKLNVGMSYLEVVRQFAKTGIDFECVYSAGAGFVFKAYKNGIGTDKSETIFFRVGGNCEEVHSDERGDEIQNALSVAWKDGIVSLEDATSIAAYGRHEGYLDAKIAQTASSATTYGAAILANRKDPKKGISVKIWDGVGPRVYVDYNIGDTITLDILGVETTYRVLGLELDWDGRDYTSVIVELNNLMLENEIQMAQDIENLLNQWNTAHDADLLEVSFWAAIGSDSYPVENGTYSGQTFLLGDKIYTISDTLTTVAYCYDIPTGTWSTIVVGGSTVMCFESIGTDLYIGCHLGIYKYDTLTGTVTNVGVTDDGGDGTQRFFRMAVIGTDLYTVGTYATIDGVATGQFAKYNSLTDTWTSAGNANLTGTFIAWHDMLAVGSNIYFCGKFDTIGGVANTQNVAMWNGTTMVALGTGLDAVVYSLAAYGSNILAGGAQTGSISEWDGVSWTTFGGGITGGVLGVAVYLTDVYVVGSFVDVGNHIARHSGGVWWELLTGLNNTATDIVLYGDDVYVRGTFTAADGKPALSIAAYFTNFDSLVGYLENSSNSFDMGAAIHAATASAITDSDEVPFWEDVANALRKITWANIKATLKTYFDTLYVALTGNQSIDGIKTFTSFSITPSAAPTTDYQIANKKYVDDGVGGAGTVTSVTGDGVGGTATDIVMTFPTPGDIGALQPNAPITPDTNTKITYDANGLVTVGADASTVDIISYPGTVLGNVVPDSTFGTNTGWTGEVVGVAEITGGVFAFTAADVEVPMLAGVLEIGTTYIMTYDLVVTSGDYIQFSLGNTNGAQQTTSGSKTEQLTVTDLANLYISFSNFTGTLDNLIVKPITLFDVLASKQSLLGYTPLNAASNLSDVASVATARTNLGLGAAALLAVPITAANGGTGISNGASATLTLPNLEITLGGGGAAQTYTLPAAGGTFSLLNAANVYTTQQMVDGTSDQIQLRVQAHSTQTTNLQTFENSSGVVLAGFQGRGTLFSNLGTSTTNLFIGLNSGNTTATGDTNTGIGNLALAALTSGEKNFAMGVRALTKCTIGNFNFAAGTDAMANFVSGTGNVALGANSLIAYTGGNYNTAVGYIALASVVSGEENTALGRAAGGLYTATGGIFLGHAAGYRQTSTGSLLIIDNTLRASAAVEAQNSFLYGSMAAGGYLQLNIPTTTNNAVVNAFKLQSYVSTAATGSANGFGVGLPFYAETATDATYQQQGLISTSWIDATNASRKAKMSLSAYDTAARLGIEIEASGTVAKLGLFGVATVVQPAGANQAALTNSTGGTYNGTLIDVGIVFSQANINDNFTDVHTLLNEIRTALVSVGIMKGSA